MIDARSLEAGRAVADQVLGAAGYCVIEHPTPATEADRLQGHQEGTPTWTEERVFVGGIPRRVEGGTPGYPGSSASEEPILLPRTTALQQGDRILYPCRISDLIGISDWRELPAPIVRYTVASKRIVQTPFIFTIAYLIVFRSGGL